MLKLCKITKVYETAGERVTALRGIDLAFRRNEFVAILGQSGCGKTTLLNIVGGLDHYTDGDLIINGRSTREFKDGDWDTYRNHSIGFVFQSYNLISHQTILSNVELALTLSGVGRAERRRRAAEALEKVGLAAHMKKRPNQLSGGQMQRVAIARALVNDPDIVLADEPTGALDSETSVQVMDLLAEIARDRLVIMVTHNPELAQQYATRTIRLLDGQVVDDTAPYDGEEGEPVPAKAAPKQKKRSMSFATAFTLSLNNLMTKKGRTFLTSFAGSIGIIGIALILSLSAGINTYIEKVQEDTLASYPVTILAESVDMTDMMVSMMGARHGEDQEPRDQSRVYASTVMYDMLNAMTSAETETNDLRAFKAYLDGGESGIPEIAAVQYTYDFPFDVYTKDENGDIVKCDVMTLLQKAMTTMYGGDYSSYFANMGAMYEQMNVWTELLPGGDGEGVSPQLGSQYDMLYGRWPEAEDEVVLFVDQNNELSDLMLYAMGLLSADSMTESLNAAMAGEQIDAQSRSWTYEELCQAEFKLILPAQRYQRDAASGGYTDLGATAAGMDFLYNSNENGLRLKVVGVARPAGDGASAPLQGGGIGYTAALTRRAIAQTAQADVVIRQLEDRNTDALTGLPFYREGDPEPTAEEQAQAVRDYLLSRPVGEQAEAYLQVMSQPAQAYVDDVVAQQTADMTRQSIQDMIITQYADEMGVDGETVAAYIRDMDDETLFAQVEEAVAQQVREQYAQGVQARLGAVSQEELAAMLAAAMDEGGQAGPVQPLEPWQYAYLYENCIPPTVSYATAEENLEKLGYVDLDSPDAINIYATTFADKDRIADLIAAYNDGVGEEKAITYTDYVALLMSSVTGIISGISYLLIAFVSISLVVSSIMIGIITYISVLERTKEIGILRAVGASKRDVGRVFNAETLIVGLGAGVLGIGVTAPLLLPINAILLHYTGLTGLKAALPWQGAAVLVAISALLTILAGLIPARVAARKDPVVALRTE